MKRSRIIAFISLMCICLAPLPLRQQALAQANINAPTGLNGKRNSNAGQATKPDKPAQASKPDKPAKQDGKQDAKQDSKHDSKPGKQDAKPSKSDSRNSDRSLSSNGTSMRNQSVAGHRRGWRIQAYQTSQSRTGKQKATERGRAIAMKFPQYRTYITYKAPSWRLRIGDFDDEDAAKKALRALRARFPAYASEMTIVRDKVNVWK